MTQSMNESVTRLFVEQPLASPVSAIYIQTAYIVFKAVKQTQLLRQTCSVKLARTGRSREKYCWDNLTTKQTKTQDQLTELHANTSKRPHVTSLGILFPQYASWPAFVCADAKFPWLVPYYSCLIGSNSKHLCPNLLFLAVHANLAVIAAQ